MISSVSRNHKWLINQEYSEIIYAKIKILVFEICSIVQEKCRDISFSLNAADKNLSHPTVIVANQSHRQWVDCIEWVVLSKTNVFWIMNFYTCRRRKKMLETKPHINFYLWRTWRNEFVYFYKWLASLMVFKLRWTWY